MECAEILVIDDEIEICNLIKNALKKQGHIVTVRNNAIDINEEDLIKFDLILLDVMMPGIDGFTLCKNIRDEVDCPIIFITAKTMEEDILEGFSTGGDDYIKKPFSIIELRARVEAHLRREHREKHQILSTNGLKFNLKPKEIYFNDYKIALTKGEYAICEYLAKHRGQVFSLEQIFIEVYGYEKDSDNSCIREHIKNIRAKITKCIESPIETVWGIGYKWK
ncbi:two-component response regulator [[Clostridium] sordellii]|uniref:Stage 0 sporulation protein A homolog n=1 Tax=Paraclostridium sordellii TaxID=1505 RepID=A0ABM9RNP6_PARSO|nr:response regulator transcription factor [Paeniclostridium sordellii]CEJ73668.1 Two-component response regulator [[Clostridium] sordellii] [Paeniclostridium sordellii]CEN69216.1 two-component response regulator [[Clostridium] sordellii] [Paeniclostridium sordellii]CEN72484.1 two-component response regulator [[Clostridium] sordellii] [Paeniclostridium sordellii]CEO23977.1 two-component response regulator [[Clostridium] sordellii] [Paeniclostridium sordellii]CEP75923.1 two-component response r